MAHLLITNEVHHQVQFGQLGEVGQISQALQLHLGQVQIPQFPQIGARTQQGTRLHRQLVHPAGPEDKFIVVGFGVVVLLSLVEPVGDFPVVAQLGWGLLWVIGVNHI